MKQATPKVGARRLRKLADFIETKVPRKRFKMARYFSSTEPLTLEPDCGTSACALGWATMVFPGILRCDFDVVSIVGHPFKWGDRAAAYAFGITEDQAIVLFGTVPRTPKQEARLLRKAADELDGGA